MFSVTEKCSYIFTMGQVVNSIICFILSFNSYLECVVPFSLKLMRVCISLCVLTTCPMLLTIPNFINCCFTVCPDGDLINISNRCHAQTSSLQNDSYCCAMYNIFLVWADNVYKWRSSYAHSTGYFWSWMECSGYSYTGVCGCSMDIL